MEFDIKMFYRIGMVCFAIIVLMQLFQLIFFLDNYNVFSLISAIMYIIFNSALVALFAHMLKMQGDNIEVTESYEDIDQLVKEFENENKH